MLAKYNMTREQNIFVAKRNIVDYIWKSAKLEGLAVTYPDTEAIFNGMSVPGIKVSEIVAVNNLKHAWQFLLDNLDYPIDYSYICKLNQIVGGTTWKPDMPLELQIKEELADIGKLENQTEKAVTLMLYLMRKQMFLDGNKRTYMLAANQVMISSGCGIISVPIEHQRDFTKMLVEFYESNDMQPLKTFVYDYCIDGIDFEPVPRQAQADAKEELER